MGKHFYLPRDQIKEFGKAGMANFDHRTGKSFYAIETVGGRGEQTPIGSKETHGYAEEPRAGRSPRTDAFHNLMGGSRRHGMWIEDVGNCQCRVRNFKTKAVLFVGSDVDALKFMDSQPLVV